MKKLIHYDEYCKKNIACGGHPSGRLLKRRASLRRPAARGLNGAKNIVIFENHLGFKKKKHRTADFFLRTGDLFLRTGAPAEVLIPAGEGGQVYLSAGEVDVGDVESLCDYRIP